MSTRKSTKVNVLGEGGTVVQKGGVGVLVNNLHSQIPQAGPPLQELEDTTLVGLFFPLFSKTGRLLCSMRHQPP